MVYDLRPIFLEIENIFFAYVGAEKRDFTCRSIAFNIVKHVITSISR